MINFSPKDKKGLPEQTFFDRSSVLQGGILQLKPQILRGNTEAPYKLLLHTPTGSIVLPGLEVKSYPQGTKRALYAMPLEVKWLSPFYFLEVSMSIRALTQKICQSMICWKVWSVSHGQLYHGKAIKI
mgnify:CR=1 FL=1